METSPVNLSQNFCVFFSGHFSKFSKKKYMDNFFFLDELDIASLKKGFLIVVSCRNIP